MDSLKNIAILLPFNDLGSIQGGSKVGIKSKISYFDMFLMLYESIKSNWVTEFKYQIYVIHSIPFSAERQVILDCLDVKVLLVDPVDHAIKIRPAAYTINIDCDFRLILDVDMIALNEPCFDFSYDVQAGYGGNKYSKNQWRAICHYLDCDMPKYKIIRLRKGSYKSWTAIEPYLYHVGLIWSNIFPYFNNGAVLVENSMSPKLADVWLRYRRLYTEYIKMTEGENIDLEGQDVIGLAINKVTKNWRALPRGFNYALNENFFLGRRLSSRKVENISLLHYINITESNKFYDIVNLYHELISEKYYS